MLRAQGRKTWCRGPSPGSQPVNLDKTHADAFARPMLVISLVVFEHF